MHWLMAQVEKTSDGFYCWTLHVQDNCEKPDSPCCNADLKKIEINVSKCTAPACRICIQASAWHDMLGQASFHKSMQ